MSEWIRVDNKLPDEKDGAVIVWHGDYVGIAALFGGTWLDTVHGESYPTHWMQLPEPPTK